MQKALLAGVILLVVSASAKATLLAPGTTVSSTTLIGPVGTMLATMDSGFVGNDAFGTTLFSGVLRSQIWDEGAGNPLGGLTFAYCLRNDGSSADAISRLVLNAVGPYLLDVGYVPSMIFGIVPLSFARSADGHRVTVDFPPETSVSGGVPPGMDSCTIILRTDATWQYVGSVSMIDGGVGTALAYKPSGPMMGASPNPVPEPSALVLLGMGSISFICLRCRRHILPQR